MNNDFEKFCKNFDLVQNALDMRNIVRWNGRNLRYRENLAEHTHLVVACLLKILYDFENVYKIELSVDMSAVIKAAMMHDSLEVLRGDILSITKDSLPELREIVEQEEEDFLDKALGYELTYDERAIIRLADLMACYKFIENELQYPNNNFAKNVYFTTKAKYDKYLSHVLSLKGYCEKQIIVDETVRLVKGYEADAGTDIIVTSNCVFPPMSTTTIDLGLQITPNKDEMAVLCARTSAANKGLCVAMCPIDPNYTGNVMAIVHNVSNEIITYNKGESFCQYIMIPIKTMGADLIKRKGVRSTGNLGSTDKKEE